MIGPSFGGPCYPSAMLRKHAGFKGDNGARIKRLPNTSQGFIRCPLPRRAEYKIGFTEKLSNR